MLDLKPRKPADVDGRRIASGDRDAYWIESIDSAVEPEERVPALVVVPDGVNATGPATAVAV